MSAFVLGFSLPPLSLTMFSSSGEILSHVEGTDRYKRMRNLNIVRGLTEDGHYDEKHAALHFVDLMHGLACLHRCVLCLSACEKNVCFSVVPASARPACSDDPFVVSTGTASVTEISNRRYDFSPPCFVVLFVIVPLFPRVGSPFSPQNIL